MTSIEDVLTVAAAGWVIAYCLVYLEGPFDVFTRLRVAIGAEARNPYDEQPDGFTGKLFRCMYCATFWTALLMAGLWWLEPEAVRVISAWGVAAVVHALISHEGRAT